MRLFHVDCAACGSHVEFAGTSKLPCDCDAADKTFTKVVDGVTIYRKSLAEMFGKIV